MAQSSPPTRRTTATRARLVKAATEVVARRGFHAASVDEIAKRAGFSIGALYWNFASKDELFLAVFDEHVSWFERQLTEAVGSADTSAGASEWIERIARRPQQFLIFIEFWAYAVRTPKIRGAFAQRMREMRQTAATALQSRADAAGTEPPMPPELAALVGLAIGRGLAIEKLADPDGVHHEHIAQLLRGLAT